MRTEPDLKKTISSSATSRNNMWGIRKLHERKELSSHLDLEKLQGITLAKHEAMTEEEQRGIAFGTLNGEGDDIIANDWYSNVVHLNKQPLTDYFKTFTQDPKNDGLIFQAVAQDNASEFEKIINQEILPAFSPHPGVQKFIKKFANQNAILHLGKDIFFDLFGDSAYLIKTPQPEAMNFYTQEDGSVKFQVTFDLFEQFQPSGKILKIKEPEQFGSLRFECFIRPEGENDARLDITKLDAFGDIIPDTLRQSPLSKYIATTDSTDKALDFLRNLDLADPIAITEFLKMVVPTFDHELHSVIDIHTDGSIFNADSIAPSVEGLLKEKLTSDDVNKMDTIFKEFTGHNSEAYFFITFNGMAQSLKQKNKIQISKKKTHYKLRTHPEHEIFKQSLVDISGYSSRSPMRLFESLIELAIKAKKQFPRMSHGGLVDYFSKVLIPYFVGLKFDNNMFEAIEKCITRIYPSRTELAEADQSIKDIQLGMDIARATLDSERIITIDSAMQENILIEIVSINLEKIFNYKNEENITGLIDAIKQLGQLRNAAFDSVEKGVDFLNKNFNKLLTEKTLPHIRLAQIEEILNEISLALNDESKKEKLSNHNKNYEKIAANITAGIELLKQLQPPQLNSNEKPEKSSEKTEADDKKASEKIKAEAAHYFYHELIHNEAKQIVAPLSEAVKSDSTSLIPAPVNTELKKLEETLYLEAKSDLEKEPLATLLNGKAAEKIKASDIGKVTNETVKFVCALKMQKADSAQQITTAETYKNTVIKLTTREKLKVAISGFAGAVVGFFNGLFDKKAKAVEIASKSKEVFKNAAAPGGKGLGAAYRQCTSHTFFQSAVNPRRAAVNEIAKTVLGENAVNTSNNNPSFNEKPGAGRPRHHSV